MQVHIARDGKQLGIFSLDEINRQLAAGTLNLSDQAWYEGAAGWAALVTAASSYYVVGACGPILGVGRQLYVFLGVAESCNHLDHHEMQTPRLRLCLGARG